MSITLFGYPAIAIYLITIVVAIRTIILQKSHTLILILSITALILHCVVLWELVILNWVNLGVYHALSFVSAFTLAILLFFKGKFLVNLLIFILPITALALGLELLNPETVRIYNQVDSYLDTHITLSILAYSFLAISAVLAIFSYVQEKLLKTKHTYMILRTLPPLIELERTMFKITYVGFVLLTLALTSGFVFLENIFAQGILHKTLLGVLSWLVFGILLLGKRIFGWRGNIATKLSLLGFFLIILAYFGSKIVLKLLI